MLRRGSAFMLVAAALSAVGGAASAGTQAGVPHALDYGAPVSQAQAASTDAWLLDHVRLPAGTMPSAAHPAAALGAPPPKLDATHADVVTASRLWQSPEPPGGVVAPLRGRALAGLAANGDDRNAFGAPVLHFGVDPGPFSIQGNVRSRTLTVTVARSGTGSQVRVDASVGWVPPRPAATIIPTDVASARVTVTSTGYLSTPVVTTTTSAALRPSVAVSLVKALNAMQVVVGYGLPCKPTGPHYSVTILAGGHTWTANEFLCGGISVSRPGVASVFLTGSPAYFDLLMHLGR